MTPEGLLSASKLILYVGTFLVALGSVAVAHFTAKTDELKDRKIDSLLSGTQRLENGNRELAQQIAAYQADLRAKQREIEELKSSAAKAKRGVISLWDFNGARREGRAGKMSVSVGREAQVFQEFLRLEESRRFADLLALAQEQLTKTPDWLTPRYFVGVALANLGQLDAARHELQSVLEAAAGDESYSPAAEVLRQIETHQRGRT
jgi:hypothetical protein